MSPRPHLCHIQSCTAAPSHFIPPHAPTAPLILFLSLTFCAAILKLLKALNNRLLRKSNQQVRFYLAKGNKSFKNVYGSSPA